MSVHMQMLDTFHESEMQLAHLDRATSVAHAQNEASMFECCRCTCSLGFQTFKLVSFFLFPLIRVANAYLFQRMQQEQQQTSDEVYSTLP